MTGWDEAYAAFAVVLEMSAECDEPAILLHQVASDFGLPPGGFADYAAHCLLSAHQVNFRMVIFITKNTSIPSLWQAALSVHADDQTAPHYYVRTLDEARALFDDAD